MQGNVIHNNKVKTIVRAVMDTWILYFGIQSVGFNADNGGEFVNIKMDKLIARLGVTICIGWQGQSEVILHASISRA